MLCPVCGEYEFPEENSFDICPICDWENDGVQADDHNYAGGANHLSVNEARIEFFLLKNKSTRKTAIERREKFEEDCHRIQKKYAGLNYVEELEKAKQQVQEFESVRIKYLNDLNDILQKINVGGFAPRTP